MLVFALLMLAASISMIRKGKSADQIKEGCPVNYIKLILQSVVIGIITGFVGVGGGFLIIPSLVLFTALPMKKAVGSSLMVMAFSSLLGVMGDISRLAAINYSFFTNIHRLCHCRYNCRNLPQQTHTGSKIETCFRLVCNDGSICFDQHTRQIMWKMGNS